MRGVVAAGHPVTAEAGAEVLRAGGNAVDAAVACVLTSFVAESPLTGPGAGGFMLLHVAGAEGGADHLLDFFVAAPGKGQDSLEPAELVPIDVKFAEGAVQRFNAGPSSNGVYGTTKGLEEALARFGTLTLADLCERPARLAREGFEVLPMQAFLFTVLEPIFRSTPECEAIYAPHGRLLQAGEKIRLPELGDLLERLGAEGPGFLGRHPDRRRAGHPRADGEPRRRGDRGRGDRLDQPGPRRGLPRGVGHRGLPGAVPGRRRPRHRRRRGALEARLDHASRGDGRGGLVRVDHLLERLRVRGGGARHRPAPEQHARRAGLEPARLPPAQ